METMSVVTSVDKFTRGNIAKVEQEKTLIKMKSMGEAKKIGNPKAFNVIILGLAAKHMDFSKEDWLTVIEKTVPPKTIEINKNAFEVGYQYNE